MKKTLLFGTALLMAGCTCGGGCVRPLESAPENQVEVPVIQEEAASVAVPCSYSCLQPGNCQSSDPIVLKPRVTEVADTSVRSGFGDKKTTSVPDAPEIYVISANRTINSMQSEAAALFKQVGDMTVYVDSAKPKSDDLPGGMDKGTDTIVKRMAQMEKVRVVYSKPMADFVIDSTADWYDTATKTVPAIKYDINLKDKNGNLIGEWSEIIHQAEGDRSWW